MFQLSRVSRPMDALSHRSCRPSEMLCNSSCCAYKPRTTTLRRSGRAANRVTTFRRLAVTNTLCVTLCVVERCPCRYFGFLFRNRNDV